MKIKSACHFTSVHGPEDTRIISKECISLSGYLSNIYFVYLGDVVKNSKIKYIPVMHRPETRFKRLTIGIWKIYKSLKKTNADVFHFHDPELILLGLLLKLKGKKVIYDVHEDVGLQIKSKYWIPSFLRGIVAFVFNTIEKIACVFFDYIITATPEIAKKFRRFNNAVVDINNYPILSEFSLCKKDIESKYVCYVGSITYVRGIFDIVDAIQYANVKLVLGGNFSPQCLLEKVKTLPGWSKVEYRGFLSRNGIKNVINNAVAGLVVLHPIPNYLEARPVKMYEYMAGGIPVISSNFPAWRKIIEEEECGLCVNPQNPQALLQAIYFISRNPKIAEKMGENGRRAIEERYNWSKEEEKLIKVYSSI